MFLGVFRKMIFFLGGGGGVRRLCGYFWGSSQKWASLRVISMQLRIKYRIGIFFGVLKFQIFLGVLKIPIIFFFGER